jgi:hypothetical protein
MPFGIVLNTSLNSVEAVLGATAVDNRSSCVCLPFVNLPDCVSCTMRDRCGPFPFIMLLS